MFWEKKGLVHTCDFYGTGYAQDAFIDKLDNGVWRIYFSTRDANVVSHPFFLETEAGNPRKILRRSEQPLFEPGRPGTFDDTGITMTSIVRIDEHRKYLYYCGWNRKITVSYSLSIGCVEVIDDCIFRKISEGPVMERSVWNPIAVSAPMVIREGDTFRMWYITFVSWEECNGRLEPVYVVKHAVSDDGLNWKCNSRVCVGSSYPGESIGRPWVIRDDGIYKMWFSQRGNRGYRTAGGEHYMIGYAESPDGINWERKPFDFTTSESGWDSEMLEYASVAKHGDDYYMLYNGNAFGKTGFGYAVGRREQ